MGKVRKAPGARLCNTGLASRLHVDSVIWWDIRDLVSLSFRDKAEELGLHTAGSWLVFKVELTIFSSGEFRGG